MPEFSSRGSGLNVETDIFATAFDGQVLIINMSKNIKLKRGFDLNLKGGAEQKLVEVAQPETFALKPTDFHHIVMPKMLVAEGDNVKAGTPLFYEKSTESVKYCAPVSGEIVEIKRGAKRRVLEVKILADKEVEYVSFKKFSASDINALSREDAIAHMGEGGVWPQVVQRPFGIVADPATTPQAIFISGFDSHPLAPDVAFTLAEDAAYFQTGINVLRKLTDGDINLTVNAKAEMPAIYSNLEGVVMHKISGSHPAGNVGVQIHHIRPISKGNLIWTVSPYGVVQIGKLFAEGRYDASRRIAVTGSEVKAPAYVKTYTGACLNKIVEAMTDPGNNRYISGNPLTGESVGKDGYLGFYHHQVTVIPEGDHEEFFGWLMPSAKKLSFHRTLGLMSFLNRKQKHVVDTNQHGEARNFVVTGSFEEVMPMDILPMYLFKAIMTEDYEAMEGLGIFEVVEEDVALCEFIDVSKHELQSLVREGIELIRNS